VRALVALVALIALAQLAAAGPIALLASDGSTPLVGARIVAEKLDGERVELTVPPDGSVTVREVPLGILKITVVSWKGVPVNYHVPGHTSEQHGDRTRNTQADS